MSNNTQIRFVKESDLVSHLYIGDGDIKELTECITIKNDDPNPNKVFRIHLDGSGISFQDHTKVEEERIVFRKERRKSSRTNSSQDYGESSSHIRDDRRSPRSNKCENRVKHFKNKRRSSRKRKRSPSKYD